MKAFQLIFLCLFLVASVTSAWERFCACTECSSPAEAASDCDGRGQAHGCCGEPSDHDAGTSDKDSGHSCTCTAKMMSCDRADPVSVAIAVVHRAHVSFDSAMHPGIWVPHYTRPLSAAPPGWRARICESTAFSRHLPLRI